MNQLLEYYCSTRPCTPSQILSVSKPNDLAILRHGFVALALYKGHRAIDVARFIGKHHSTIGHSQKKFRELVEVGDDMTEKLVRWNELMVDPSINHRASRLAPSITQLKINDKTFAIDSAYVVFSGNLMEIVTK